jgi:hypothetical protein
VRANGVSWVFGIKNGVPAIATTECAVLLQTTRPGLFYSS